ncbi:MAG: guanosine-3',5'-bis(diphosphate) 3'-pyrophosphohydrolase [Deltaproteobacteria bacterium]|nr:guanosine-3',5'-bis(diphosphate) 3'-pyrophosphohydrolase [Deltaproteobacteria bacterium]
MSTIEKAIELASREHAGMRDKAGAPYIFHPLRVMFAVSKPLEKIVAVLHDIVEDTPTTLGDLQKLGFPFEALQALEALTRRKGESRMDAAKRAAENPIALVVKLADVKDNMDLNRMENPTEKDFNRLKEYIKVKKYLESRAAT